jgi:hypothetical protein
MVESVRLKTYDEAEERCGLQEIYDMILGAWGRARGL